MSPKAMVNKRNYSLDAKQVSKTQSHEVRVLTDHWFDKNGNKVSKDTVIDIIKKIGKSRRAIYAVLRYLDFRYVQKKK